MSNFIKAFFYRKKLISFKNTPFSTIFALFNGKNSIVIHLSTELSTLQNYAVDKLFHKAVKHSNL